MEDLQQLVADLTRGAPCENPREQAWALYHWVANHIRYDIEAFRCGTHSEAGDAGQRALNSRKATCSGYAALFQQLCRLLDIPCVRVQGHVKGTDFRPGDAICEQIPNHEWNAVQLQGRWQLVDCCWGAGYVTEECREFVPHFRDCYFCPQPEVFARDHFPLDRRWQLLAEEMSLQDFQDGVHVFPSCQLLGVRVDSSNQHGVLHVDVEGKVTVTIHMDKPVFLTYELKCLPSGKRFSKCVSFVKTATSATFLVSPPRAGNYLFSVYGGCAHSRDAPLCLLRYTVLTNLGAQNSLPFPNLTKPWGLTKYGRQLTLKVKGTESSCLTTQEGVATLTLTYFTQPMAFCAGLYDTSGGSLNLVPRAASLRVSHNAVDIIVRPPPPGCYWLSIYAKPAMANKFLCVANYLVVCEGGELCPAPLPYCPVPAESGLTCGQVGSWIDSTLQKYKQWSLWITNMWRGL